LSDGLLLLETTGVGLLAHATTTPLTAELVVTIQEVGLDGINNLSKIGLVILVDGSESQSSGSLLANNLSKTSLALDNGIRHLHLAAESGKPDDNFQGINVMSNQHKSGLLLFDQSSDVLDTIFYNVGLGRGLNLVAIRTSLGSSKETVLLLSLSLGCVLVQQLEELGS